MGDLIFVLVVVAFFAAAALFVRWCDHLVGPDDLAPPSDDARADTASAAVAGTEARR